MKLFILSLLLSAIFSQELVIGVQSVPSYDSLHSSQDFNSPLKEKFERLTNKSSNSSKIPKIAPTPQTNKTMPRPFPPPKNWTGPQINQTSQNSSNSTVGPQHPSQNTTSNSTHPCFPPQFNSTNCSRPCWGKGMGRHQGQRDSHHGGWHQRGHHGGWHQRGRHGGWNQRGRHQGGQDEEDNWHRHQGWHQRAKHQDERRDQNDRIDDKPWHGYDFHENQQNEMFKNFENQNFPQFQEVHFTFEPGNNFPQFSDFQQFDFKDDEFMSEQFKQMDQFMNDMLNNEFQINEFHHQFEQEQIEPQEQKENLSEEQKKKLKKLEKKLKKKFKKCPECFENSNLEELLEQQRSEYFQKEGDNQYNWHSHHHRKHPHHCLLVIIPILFLLLICCCCICKRRKAKRCKIQQKKNQRKQRSNIVQRNQPEIIDLTGPQVNTNQFQTKYQKKQSQPLPQQFQMIPMNYPLAIQPQVPQVPLQNLAYSYPQMPMQMNRTNQFSNSMNVYPDLQSFQV